MRITTDTPAETRKHARRVAFEGRPAEPFVTQYSAYKGKHWIPDHAHASWDHGQPITKISLRGHLLKRDGTPSESRADSTYVTPANKIYGTGHRLYPDAPAWLLDLFADSPHTTPTHN